MATKDEIQRWIWNAEEKHRRNKQIIADCDKQIARLQPVYDELGRLKDDLSHLRKSTEKVFNGKATVWRGEQYSSFCEAGDALDTSLSEYYVLLDSVQDGVNQKIADLKKEKYRVNNIIGGLLSQIAQWRVDLSNALN